MTDKKTRWKKWAGIHLLILAAGAAYLLVTPGCPLRLATGVPCPTCGMTRALWAAARFDFSAAFRFHPLFWFVPPLVWYAFHMNQPWMGWAPKKARLPAVIAGCAAVAAVWAVRLAYGLIP